MKSLLTAISAALLLLTAAPVDAQTVESLDALFKSWMAKHKVELGVLAVSRHGKLMFNRGYGGRDADRAVPLASLSKAITGVCTASLIDAGKLAFDVKVGDALAGYFKKFGEPRDPRIKSATLAQLLTHRAGFDRDAVDAGGKKITGPYVNDHLQEESPTRPATQKLVWRALRYRLPHDPGARFSYTNEAYFLVGAVIEEATGQPYADYCEDAVLRPLGLRGAKLDAEWGVYSSVGGWSLSAPQYLRFLQFVDAGSPVLGPLGRAFLESGEDKWEDDKHDIYYALGMNVRRANDGRLTLWHGGEFRSVVNSRVYGRLAHDSGTYAVRYPSGISWFAQYEPNPRGSGRDELVGLLVKALGAIKQWPEEDLYTELDKQK